MSLYLLARFNESANTVSYENTSELFHVNGRSDGLRDRLQLTVAFRSSENACKIALLNNILLTKQF
jgi:hypothetical protein